MSHKAIMGFPTLDMAEAFMDGMLYVNDSAIEEVEVMPGESGTWYVKFEDTDYDEDVELTYVRNNMGA
jgi:uncharacterized cupredoxin-like copper-binding protein